MVGPFFNAVFGERGTLRPYVPVSCLVIKGRNRYTVISVFFVSLFGLCIYEFPAPAMRAILGTAALQSLHYGAHGNCYLALLLRNGSVSFRKYCVLVCRTTFVACVQDFHVFGGIPQVSSDTGLG